MDVQVLEYPQIVNGNVMEDTLKILTFVLETESVLLKILAFVTLRGILQRIVIPFFMFGLMFLL